MDTPSSWIEHLQHPLVLVGFALFLFAGLFKLIKTEKITGKASAELMNKGVNYLFVLALLALAGGFGLTFFNAHNAQQTTNPVKNLQQRSSTLSTKGNISPAVQAQGDVSINYGGTLSGKSTPTPQKSAEIIPADINTEGYKSPAVNSGNDVNINFGN